MYFCVYTKLCVQNCAYTKFCEHAQLGEANPMHDISRPRLSHRLHRAWPFGGKKRKAAEREREIEVKFTLSSLWSLEKKTQFSAKPEDAKRKSQISIIRKNQVAPENKYERRKRWEQKLNGGWLGIVRWIYLCLRYHSPSLSRFHSHSR